MHISKGPEVNMPLDYVTGDPMLTSAQTLAFGHNARGQTEVADLSFKLRQQHPAAFAAYEQRCRKGRVRAGEHFLWLDSRPRLLFMALRESAAGTTRLRYVQSVALTIARDFRLEGITSLAIVPLFHNDSDRMTWDEMKKVLEQWLGPSTLPVVIYDQVMHGIRADEPWPSEG